MRLLVANYHARPVGGVETYLRAILPPLATRADVALLTRESGDPGPDGVPVPGVEWLPGAGDTPERVLDTATRWRPDVVYTHGLGDPDIERALAERFPTVAFMHNYGASCASGTKCHAAPVPMPCSRPLGPACLVTWWPRRCGGLHPLTAWRMYGDATRRRSMLRACRGVAVSSRHMVEELSRSGVEPRRLHHLPLFPTAFSPDPGPPSPRPFSGRVLFAGRVTALKGWTHLVEALPEAAAALGRSLTLVAAGDGPDRDPFEQACRAAGIRAEFPGWLDAAALAAEMRRADLLLLPSIWPEPFGLVGIEAGCMGLPAVAHAVGGVTEWLTAGASGELALASPPRADAFTRAMVHALADADRWHHLRVGAWKVASRFTREAHLAALLPLLNRAADPAGSPTRTTS